MKTLCLFLFSLERNNMNLRDPWYVKSTIKVNTEACKKVIVEFFDQHPTVKNPILINIKNWKRISKKGNKQKGFVRQFVNKVYNENFIVNVHSTETEIKCLKFNLIPDRITQINNHSSLITTIKERVDIDAIDEDDRYWPIIDAIQQLPFNQIPRVPNYNQYCNIVGLDNTEDEENYDETETLDFENFEVINLTSDTITIFCGGDWQYPGTWSATLRNGILEYNNDVNYEIRPQELSEEELIRILGL